MQDLSNLFTEQSPPWQRRTPPPTAEFSAALTRSDPSKLPLQRMPANFVTLTVKCRRTSWAAGPARHISLNPAREAFILSQILVEDCASRIDFGKLSNARFGM
uniref:(northern house mosquito) hypothetical protein n=1 Tax=Culex pipiens TaxID=7175 RepID=A0A8D8ACE0_CULPI